MYNDPFKPDTVVCFTVIPKDLFSKTSQGWFCMSDTMACSDTISLHKTVSIHSDFYLNFLYLRKYYFVNLQIRRNMPAVLTLDGHGVVMHKVSSSQISHTLYWIHTL